LPLLLILLPTHSLRQILNFVLRRRTAMFRVISRKRRIELPRFARAIVSGVAPLLLASPAFAQIGGDRVSSFLSNALSYAQSLGIFGAGFLVIWAVANIARERPSGKQWAGAGGALLLSSLLQLLRTFAG
jgi:hypothetical protein